MWKKMAERRTRNEWHCHLPRRIWVGQQINPVNGPAMELGPKVVINWRRRAGPGNRYITSTNWIYEINCVSMSFIGKILACHLIRTIVSEVYFSEFLGRARRTTCICSFIKLISLRPSQRCQPATVALLHWKACCCLVYQGIAMSSVWAVEQCGNLPGCIQIGHSWQ